MTESVSQISSTPMVRDPPPHMEDSIFDRPTLEISKELNTISSLVFDNEVPDNLSLSLYKTEKIPGLFPLHHINQIMAKSWIIKALELASLTYTDQSPEFTR